MVEYGDFFIVLIPAFAMQILSIVYTIKIRKLIGNKWTQLYLESSSYMLSYDLIVAWLMALAYSRPETQAIELWGLYIAFVFPLLMGFNSIRKQRTLYKSVTPNEGRRFKWW